MLTIVIPAYNAGSFIGETLQSLESLGEGFAGAIVVDDGSSDDTRTVVGQHPQVRLVSQKNAGVSAARNHGLSLVETPFVWFLDADDILLPSAIEHALAAFAQYPDAPFVYGSIEEIDSFGKLLKKVPLQPGLQDLDMVLNGAIPRPSQTAFSTAHIRAAGGFDTSLSLCEDFELYTRLLADGAEAYCHGHPAVRYRRHDGQATHRVSAMMQASLGVVRKAAGESDTAAALERSWERRLGGYIPIEVLRHLSAGRLEQARSALMIYLRAFPASALGTLDIMKKRLKGTRSRP
ncbi:UDP-hexose transferase [Aurantiacibacter atlanticus]|uniref:UDP-hexose transferase n=1 Tax=Aurantiacibacter atlanticus TaxID=1648404 RepID=A0A0H4V9K4_9SPHN|nr:glycosyltransferase [Aurantiacibacter atlanticus]AKQ41277.2 UDP-hexose transferase [Aurantiacibacter atlanticus]